MGAAEGDDRVDHRLQRLGDERLQKVGLDRQAQPGLRRQVTGLAGDRNPHLAGADRALCRVHANDAVAIAQEANDLALLDNVDTKSVGATGEAPGDRVVPSGTGPALQNRAMHRKAGRGRRVDIGQVPRHRVAIQ